jgi:mRNA-degrading endonuclease RelE of RelBE toxin-antitoxin system
MGAEWLVTMKPSFTNEWLALPPKEAHQVLEKIKLLEQDPTPDAKVKKQLKHIDPRLHRIRAGDYRIFYTFEEPHISLLAVRRRREDTYDEALDIEFLGGFDLALEGTTKAAQPDWERLLAPREPEKRPCQSQSPKTCLLTCASPKSAMLASCPSRLRKTCSTAPASLKIIC